MRIACLFVAVLAIAACDKSAKPKGQPPAPITAGTVATDGTRSVPVQVRKTGYQPDQITARPNEKLRLVFTRVEDTECGAQVKVADGAAIDLPLGKAVEIPVTVPASGRIDFACGMDMMKGAIIVGG